MKSYQRILIPALLLFLAIVSLWVFRDTDPPGPSFDDIALAKIVVYNHLMETKEGQKDAEVYAYFFVPDVDKDLIARLASKVKILDASQSEIKGNAIVSKVDGKPGKGFEVKVVSMTPTSMTLFAKWVASGDAFADYKYTLEKNPTGQWTDRKR